MNPKDKTKDQSDIIKNVKNLYNLRQKIMKTLDPKPFIKQNKMKQNREQQEYKYKNGYYIYEIKK